MKLLMNVTGVTKLSDERLLVQLQGKYGNVQLNLPMDQRRGLNVGDQWTLEHATGALGFVGELDETKQPAQTDPAIRGGLSALSGKDLDEATGGLAGLAGKRKIKLDD
jgi:hypothetical protein